MCCSSSWFSVLCFSFHLSSSCVLCAQCCLCLLCSPQVLSYGVRVVHFVHYVSLHSKFRVVMSIRISAYKRRSVRLYPPVVCRSVHVVFMCFANSNCPFLIAPSVFSNVYLSKICLFIICNFVTIFFYYSNYHKSNYCNSK